MASRIFKSSAKKNGIIDVRHTPTPDKNAKAPMVASIKPPYSFENTSIIEITPIASINIPTTYKSDMRKSITGNLLFIPIGL